MNVLILYSGHLGSTEKAAKYLSDELGGAVLANTAGGPTLDFGAYDCVIFGTNVRMFRLNGRFKKYAKLWVGSATGKPAYAFVMCADELKSGGFVDKADKLLKKRGASVYAGGELNAEGAGKFERAVIGSVTAGFKKDGKPLPSINYGALRDLAEKIKTELI